MNLVSFYRAKVKVVKYLHRRKPSQNHQKEQWIQKCQFIMKNLHTKLITHQHHNLNPKSLFLQANNLNGNRHQKAKCPSMRESLRNLATTYKVRDGNHLHVVLYHCRLVYLVLHQLLIALMEVSGVLRCMITALIIVNLS